MASRVSQICHGYALGMLFVVLTFCPHNIATAASPASSSRFPKAVQKVQATVVRIHVIEVDYTSGRETKQETFGSGVIISPDGHVLTNHHVAGNGKYFTCTLADKSEFDATLIGTDALTDLAVLKLNAPSPRCYPFARFGNSGKLRVGDRVYAIGSPLTLSQSVTEGVVSNPALSKPEIFRDEWFVLDGEDFGSVMQWVAHDADIYGGNSGGPLVNTRGEIVGINQISFGLSGAIPGNLARDISSTLMAEGEVKRSWIGVTAQPLLETSPSKHGALITGALADSPAAKAGFQPGDILLRIHGKPVDVPLTESLPAFNLQLMSLPIAQPVEAVVLRGEKEHTLTVTPAVRPKAQHRPVEFLQWGFCASDLSVLLTSDLTRQSSGGVMVTSLRPGGPADNAKPAIITRDIIVSVAGEAVNSVEDLRRVTARLMDGKDEPVPTLVVYERKAEQLRTVVQVGMDATRDPGLEVRKAWLSAATQVLTTELAEALGLEDTTGVCVTRVYPNSAAEKAGLQVGDILTALDGQTISASRPEHIEVLPAMVRQYRIGTVADVSVIRGTESLTIPVELVASPRLSREMAKYRNEFFEFTARDLTFYDCVGSGWPNDQQGAIVESVTEGGWAALGHLETGDLITAIDGTSIPNIDALEKHLDRIREARPRRIVVMVKRGKRNLFLEWRANWATQS